MEMIQESDNDGQELRVTFYPELYLQRRIWVLNILRRESITRVLDVGCGEGQLLAVLCQPAPWLKAPPESVLEASQCPNESLPPTPIYNDEDTPSLHIVELHGLDVSSEDLEFATEAIAPPKEDVEQHSPGYRSFRSGLQRWEGLLAKVWKGGLESINEEFVDMECIVSMEVIEHLPPEIFPAFAPMLLGVYHPRFLLVTTPSYTFNARFTAPDAPKSARSGFVDPTGRTDRIFRHHDHKFEWTREEFVVWCEKTAKEWGYAVEQTSIGRAQQEDPWSRDAELEGASSVACFRRLEDVDNKTRGERGRARMKELSLNNEPHEALAISRHLPNPASMKPRSLKDIADCVKSKMEDYRETFMRVEELWFEKEIGILCGGWIEMLVRAVEESPELNLKRDLAPQKRSMWSVELVGGVATSIDHFSADGNTSVDYIPSDWTPGEGPYEALDENESTGAEEGDVSADTSDADEDDESDGEAASWRKGSGLKKSIAIAETSDNQWTGLDGWGQQGDNTWGEVPPSAMSSTAGWDGDESDDTTS